MPAVISLQTVIDALEAAGDELSHYLDPDTGEIQMITHEEAGIVEEEDEEDWKKRPKWQQAGLPKIRDFLRNPRTLKLPGKFDIHEWQIMREFSDAQDDPGRRRELLDAIHGSGAFRHFKSTAYRLGIEKDWYKFREQTLEKIARAWLEEHKLPYK